ncbi:MAG: methylmalonyl-CoA mutase family protein, partial [Halobacteriaceae archaeon]
MFDEEELQRIREGREEWAGDTLDPTLERFGERRDSFTTDTEGGEVGRLYTPADRADADYDEVGFPGEPPFTRGVYPTMYR